MRSDLIVCGVIFLVLGGLIYYTPTQEIRADTTVEGDTQTSSARLTVPIAWAYASGMVGLVLLILGFAAPNPVKVVPAATEVKVVNSARGARGPRGIRGPPAKRRSSRPRTVRSSRTTRTALPRGTSVTTTTRIKR